MEPSMPSIKTFKVDHLIGEQFGTSTLLKELGRGNMAIVFTAFQQTLKRRIALKLLPKIFLTADAGDRFQQEAEAAAILSHPNIIPIYEVGETDKFLFMCMQLIAGRDLHQYISSAQKHIIPSKRFIPIRATIRFLVQVLDALSYAHSQDIIHRDIKPANILVEKHSKRPLISDFGMVKFLRGDELGEGKIQGTPLFMAPEQITAQDISGKADIYAVGVMLFQMLVPALPVPDYTSMVGMLKHKRDAKEGIFLKKPSELNPILNEQMDKIIQKATAYLPAQRFKSCREFTDVLKWYQKQYLNGE